MHRSCNKCQVTFEITDEDLAFYDKVSPVFNGKKEPIPPPTLCPECRLQRRLAFRNQINVFPIISSLSGKHALSMWPETVEFPVYSMEEWMGDSWDGLAYGRAFDFSKSFFEQFRALRSVVPHPARSANNLENSDYCMNAEELKNCYMVFDTTLAEECMYGEFVNSCKDCIDCTSTIQCELCYGCVWCQRCYQLQESQECENCSESYFLLNCRSCKHCFGCANLRHAAYCVFNEQKTQEEYEAFLASVDLSSFLERETLRRQADSHFLLHPRPHSIQKRAEHSSGNMLLDVRSVHDSYQCVDSENLQYCYEILGGKDCYDYSIWGTHAELMYECSVCGIGVQHLLFCYQSLMNASNLLYCQFCFGCSDCFGCIGLKKKRFCIFNKQYTKEEYERLVPTIIQHMRETKEYGEFFPIASSPIAYNQSLAQRYFPRTKDEVRASGLEWYERDIEDARAAVDAAQLPDGLPETDETIVARSTLSGRPFKITNQEIKRYREFRVPLPRTTYDERMEERAKKLGGIRLFKRTCAKTGKPILTTYPPDSPYIIWDRDVYEQEFGS